MKRFLTIGLTVLAVFAVASCDLLGGDTPELQVRAPASPGEAAANMGHGNTIYFDAPGNGLHQDMVFTIRNTGKAKLVLKAAAPYVEIVDHSHGPLEPFSVFLGAATKSIGPGKQVQVTIRFTGTIENARYTAKLRIPSNDEEHPDYFLNLEGDGDGF